MKSTILTELIGTLVEDARRDGIERLVTGAILVRSGADPGRFLLLERRADDFLGGIYELPGGEVEPGEGVEAALCREVLEETGLVISSIEGYSGSFDYDSRSGKRARQFNFLISARAPLEVTLTEHASFVWAGIEELEELPVTENVKEIIRGALS